MYSTFESTVHCTNWLSLAKINVKKNGQKKTGNLILTGKVFRDGKLEECAIKMILALSDIKTSPKF